MRRAMWIGAVAGSYAILLGWMAVLVLALTLALGDGWAISRAAARHVDSGPRFSPDGTLVAFLRGSQVWVVQPDGSDPHPVAQAVRFAWTRRGDALLVSHGGTRVFSVSADGGIPVPAGRAELPAPGGSDRSGGRVVYVHGHHIWLRGADGKAQELT